MARGFPDFTRIVVVKKDFAQNAGVKTLTLNHSSSSGDITDMFSGDSTTWFQVSNSGSGEKISTLVLDLGKIFFIHNTHLFFTFFIGGADSATYTLKFEFSDDDSTYTEIEETTLSEVGATNKDFQSFVLDVSYKFLKITMTTSGLGGPTIRLKKLMIVP